MEWLFGIKGAIESVSKVSLRFLASLTNVLLLPSQKGIYLSVRNTLCFHFVWNPLLLRKAHLWERMNASDRHSQGEAWALTPPWQVLAFSSSILLMKCSQGPVYLANGTLWASSFLRFLLLLPPTTPSMSLKRFCFSWMFSPACLLLFYFVLFFSWKNESTLNLKEGKLALDLIVKSLPKSLGLRLPLVP